MEGMKDVGDKQHGMPGHPKVLCMVQTQAKRRFVPQTNPKPNKLCSPNLKNINTPVEDQGLVI